MSDKRILVAIDLTEEAEEVLSMARELATLHNTNELDLVNVVKPVAHTHGGLDSGAVSAMANIDQQLLTQAREMTSELAQKYGIDADRVHVKLGHPAGQIRDLAQSLGVDLIVIGTHGRHGLGRLLGSTANAVLHGVPCDVFTVRIHSHKHAA